MPLTREPRNQNIYTDEVDQKGGYTAKVRDKEARAAAKEAAETAKADLDAYKETNDTAVADLDDRLDQAELDIDAAEGAIDELEDALDVLILVQDTQPTTPDNKIWIKETATPVVIPDMDDIADFVSFTEDQTSRTDAEKAQARANIGVPKWELVWENASPSSDFAAQTVSLDLSAYSTIAVEYQYLTNVVTFTLSTCVIGSACVVVYVYDGRLHHRRVTFDSVGTVSFSDAYRTASYGSNTASNGYMIPTRIWAK